MSTTPGDDWGTTGASGGGASPNPAPPPWTPPPPAGQPGWGQQPAGGGPGWGAGTPAPPNHLVWAILSTLFCCLPLGIVSIVFAAQVEGKHSSGDVAGAMESSRKAKLFAMISAGVGLAAIVLYIIFIVVLGGLGAFTAGGFS